VGKHWESENGGSTGKSNWERRAAKKRKAERRFSQHRSTYSDGLGRTGRMDFRWLVVATASATGWRRELPEDALELLRAAAIERGSSSTGMVVDELFCDCLESVFEGEARKKLCRNVLAHSHSTIAVTGTPEVVPVVVAATPAEYHSSAGWSASGPKAQLSSAEAVA
jgi:hypothetical protein